jgi:uncharacterized protein involved in tolerance to divalent cations
MNIEEKLNGFSEVFEIRVVSDEKIELENSLASIVGNLITGYNIQEVQTCYLWEGRIERKTNYIISTLVNENNKQSVADFFYKLMKSKWETPLIQVGKYCVNDEFRRYMGQ